MRISTLICAIALCLVAVPAAPAMPVTSMPQVPIAAVASEFFPVAGKVGYGEAGARYGNFRRGHAHEGQDVFAENGTPLLAVRDSIVIKTGDDGGRGNYIALYSPEFRQTYVYLHMRLPARLRVGDRVHAGQRVGSVGCTGSCDGDHLHFEIRRGRSLTSATSNPLRLLKSLQRARR